MSFKKELLILVLLNISIVSAQTNWNSLYEQNTFQFLDSFSLEKLFLKETNYFIQTSEQHRRKKEDSLLNTILGDRASSEEAYNEKEKFANSNTNNGGGSGSPIAGGSSGSINNPPIFTSTPVTTAKELEQYAYTVTANDPDGDPVTFFLTKAPPGLRLNPSTKTLSWIPQKGDGKSPNNIYEVIIKAYDGQGTLTSTSEQKFNIIVEEKNSPPFIISQPASATINQNQPYAGLIVGGDDDLMWGFDSLTYSIEQGPSNMIIQSSSNTRAYITWTPGQENVGLNKISVKITDSSGAGAFASFDLIVNDVADAPVITSYPPLETLEDELYEYQVKFTDVDPEDTHQITFTAKPSGMIMNSEGLISWVPDNTYVGKHLVKIKVADSGGKTTYQQFYLTVVDVNDPPIITQNILPDAKEETIYQISLNQYVKDVDDTNLKYTVNNKPDWLTLVDQSTGLLSGTPANMDVGLASLTLTVSDGRGGSDTKDLTLKINNNPDPVTISSTPVTTAKNYLLYTYQINVNDDDLLNSNIGEVHTYQLVNAPYGMSVDSTGLIKWSPLNNQIGINNVEVKVTDNDGLTATQKFIVLVEKSNFPPDMIKKASYTIGEGQELLMDITAIDPEGEKITYLFENLFVNSKVENVNGRQMISWIPPHESIGQNFMKVIATDPQGLSATQNITVLVVTEINYPPKIFNDPVTEVLAGLWYESSFYGEDTEKDKLRFELLEGPEGLILIDNGNGEAFLQWKTNTDDIGSYKISFKVIDAKGSEEIKSFDLLVYTPSINTFDATLFWPETELANYYSIYVKDNTNESLNQNGAYYVNNEILTNEIKIPLIEGHDYDIMLFSYIKFNGQSYRSNAPTRTTLYVPQEDYRSAKLMGWTEINRVELPKPRRVDLNLISDYPESLLNEELKKQIVFNNLGYNFENLIIRKDFSGDGVTYTTTNNELEIKLVTRDQTKIELSIQSRYFDGVINNLSLKYSDNNDFSVKLAPNLPNEITFDHSTNSFKIKNLQLKRGDKLIFTSERIPLTIEPMFDATFNWSASKYASYYHFSVIDLTDSKYNTDQFEKIDNYRQYKLTSNQASAPLIQGHKYTVSIMPVLELYTKLYYGSWSPKEFIANSSQATIQIPLPEQADIDASKIFGLVTSGLDALLGNEYFTTSDFNGPEFMDSYLEFKTVNDELNAKMYFYPDRINLYIKSKFEGVINSISLMYLFGEDFIIEPEGDLLYNEHTNSFVLKNLNIKANIPKSFNAKLIQVEKADLPNDGFVKISRNPTTFPAPIIIRDVNKARYDVNSAPRVLNIVVTSSGEEKIISLTEDINFPGIFKGTINFAISAQEVANALIAQSR